MKILVIGLNHKSAPVAIREKLACSTEEIGRALACLKRMFCEAEFVLLSTCNRLELYCACSRVGGAADEDLAGFLSDFKGVPLCEFRPFLYVHNDADAVRHLLTVASSLDSMVVGEAQIIAQVKESYRLACAAKSTGKILNRLFHCAFATSKRVYTTTSISTGRVSVAGVAIELAMQLFANISLAKIVVIGAGEMGELLVQHLLKVGGKDITVINRSYDRALSMASRYGIGARTWEELWGQLARANIVIGSAAVQDYLFKKDSFQKMMDRRRAGSLLVIDIAVPRNFDPSVNEIDCVYLYSVDDLSDVVEQNRKARCEDVAKSMGIIHESVADFMDWFRARDIGPLIGQMKEKFSQISHNELQHFFVGARQEASCREMMEIMLNRVVNKLLHCVIKNVNVVAKENGASEAARLVDSIVRQADEIRMETRCNKKDAGH
ncbi:MAG: glutamyl-tRNA reductase [Phycisphaerales bacterium]|nr:MAG: glutamyl-tRNA reductase [Phycisphaerales bacterium]